MLNNGLEILIILYNINLIFCSYININIKHINFFNSKNYSTFSNYKANYIILLESLKKKKFNKIYYAYLI